jgi:hypothetical protein
MFDNARESCWELGSHETFCYSINEDSWAILPQGSFDDPENEDSWDDETNMSLICLGDFIYTMSRENECTSIKRLNTS